MKSTLVRLCTIGLAAAISLSAAARAADADPVLTSGFDPTATLQGAARFRNFGSGGGAEVRVGVPDGSGDIATPAEGNFTWAFPRTVTFRYDPATGLLTAGAGTLSVSKSVGPLGDLNYLQIKITKNTPTTSVSLHSLSLNTQATGDVSVTGGASTQNWNVKGVDLTNGFTLTASLSVINLSGNGDSSHVQIDVGYTVPPDTEGPVTSNVDVEPQPVILNGAGAITATVDDSTTGGNPISSAHFRIDTGVLTAMSAQDGAFDEASEDVEASFTATEVGTHQVCVHGTDSLNNAGDPTCQNYLVTYQFEGFFSPIETELVNVAKAGQAVPAKWRLTDANGAPIEHPGSFAGLFSYLVSCTNFEGDATDAVPEYASGASGLQYLGDGYWQFNWKTPKDYANTCRAMYVEFDSGATSPAVGFQFKK